jgi:hypothetical protein
LTEIEKLNNEAGIIPDVDVLKEIKEIYGFVSTVPHKADFSSESIKYNPIVLASQDRTV